MVPTQARFWRQACQQLTRRLKVSEVSKAYTNFAGSSGHWQVPCLCRDLNPSLYRLSVEALAKGLCKSTRLEKAIESLTHQLACWSAGLLVHRPAAKSASSIV